MSLYLWHSSSGAGYPGSVLLVAVLVLGGLLMPVAMSEVPTSGNNLDFGVLGGSMEYREEGNQTSSSSWVMSGGGMVIIFFLLALNLQGVAGGASLSLDSGGVVFGCSFGVIVGVMLEGVVSSLLTWSTMLLPAGSPILLASFIVVMELLSGVIRCFTLGIRLLANLLVGQILLFMWISVSMGGMAAIGSLVSIFSLASVVLSLVAVWAGGVLFFVFSAAFCYEAFVYLFQSFLYGSLLMFYGEDSQSAHQSIVSGRVHGA